ncbi:MAG: glutamyl-tRNA reductase [Elusimicrobia bacterium]|nr:glutamyl-tRNA reductase [Elusimicrobiota bacterium]
MSGLFVVGMSHLSAPVAVRERLSLRPGALAADTAALRQACGLGETVLLSTCSRFEVYAVAEDPAAAGERVQAWLEARAGVPVGAYLYLHEGSATARHLLRVASGLESWIVGETEIIGQVKAAYQGARDAGTAGRVLNILFQKGLAGAKTVRNATKIAEGIRSVGGAAAILARKLFGDSGARRVLIVGAGQMARTAAEHLRAKGVKDVTVANRTYEKAVELAEALGGTAARYDEALASLHEADIAIFSTASSDYVVGRGGVLEAAGRRRGRPLFLIDLGVPRNVDPAASEVSDVYLYDIDDLKRIVQRDQESRREAVARADALAEEAADDAWDRIERPAPAGRVS